MFTCVDTPVLQANLGQLDHRLARASGRGGVRQLHARHQVSLVLRGNEARRQLRVSPAGQPAQKPDVTTSTRPSGIATACSTRRRDTTRRCEAKSPRLNSRKNQPNAKLTVRVTKSGVPCARPQQQGRQRRTERQRIERRRSSSRSAIVSANWRKNCPTIPERNAHGMNTAISTSPTAITGGELLPSREWPHRAGPGPARCDARPLRPPRSRRRPQCRLPAPARTA